MTFAEGTPSLAVLRTRAEEALRRTRRDVAALPIDGVQGLVHELQVHQVELEMQNEELRERTRELEETRSQYQELYEFAPMGYLDLDSGGVIRRANLAAAILLDVERHRLVGRPFSAFVDPKDELVLHAHLRNTSRSIRSACEVRLSKPEGSSMCLLLATSCDPVPTAGYLMTLVDVTDGRQAREALRDQNQELERRIALGATELAEKSLRLEKERAARLASDEERRLAGGPHEAERLESMSLLVGGMAHDFGNLLAGVVCNAELLLHKMELADDVRESVTAIKRAARNASDSTRHMLVYAGQNHVKLEPVDLHRIIKDSVDLLPPLPPFAELRKELEGEPPIVEADRVQVLHVVTNLISNAFEALPESAGTVVLRTGVRALDARALARYAHAAGSQPGHFATLSISDTGRGMDAATLARVFDPFFTTKSTGRGLGLASVRGIMLAHRGAIRVRSQPGRGTTFEIAWPLSSKRGSA